MNKVLIIGPFPKPISGVSLANKVVKEALDFQKNIQTDAINTSYPFFEDAVGSFSIRKILFFLKVNFKFFKIFKNNTIYITPGQTFFGVAKYTLFIILSWLLKKELIIHVHGNFLGFQYKQLKGLKKRIFYFLISRFTKGIILSESLKPNLTPFIHKDKIFVLFNFAEDYLYENIKEANTKTLRIVYLSNLMEEKGIFYLLKSLRELENKKINYTAKIAGNIDPIIKEKIEKKINALKNTTYVGVVFGNEKKDLLEWSNIFVLPTFYKMEGQPISIIEAMATNNVVITTRHAGISDIIKNNRNGIFVEKQNSESITKAILYLDKNKSKIFEISKRNKMYFANNFTIREFNKKIIKIIDANTTPKHLQTPKKF